MFRSPFSSVTLDKGSCWVEGDNARNSLDSNAYGPISLGLVVGTASHVIWPPERWRRLHPDLSCAGKRRNIETVGENRRFVMQ